MNDPAPPIRRAGSELDAITGIEAMSAGSAPAARGFWTDAWSQVLRRPAAVIALFWVAVVASVAVLAPVLASGHPLIAWEISQSGERSGPIFPVFRFFSAADWALLVGGVVGVIVMLAPLRTERSRRLAM